jgi:hypothetical protein
VEEQIIQKRRVVDKSTMAQSLFVVIILFGVVYLGLFISFIVQKKNYVSMGNYIVQLIGLLIGLLDFVCAFAIVYGSSDIFFTYVIFGCLSLPFILIYFSYYLKKISGLLLVTLSFLSTLILIMNVDFNIKKICFVLLIVFLPMLLYGVYYLRKYKNTNLSL